MVASLFGGATALALHKGALDSDAVAIAAVARLARRGPHSRRSPIRRGCAEATPGRPPRPRPCSAFLVADLAWNNGPNESTALPPAVYEVLRPDSRDPLLGGR